MIKNMMKISIVVLVLLAISIVNLVLLVLTKRIYISILSFLAICLSVPTLLFFIGLTDVPLLYMLVYIPALLTLYILAIRLLSQGKVQILNWKKLDIQNLIVFSIFSGFLSLILYIKSTLKVHPSFKKVDIMFLSSLLDDNENLDLKNKITYDMMPAYSFSQTNRVDYIDLLEPVNELQTIAAHIYSSNALMFFIVSYILLLSMIGSIYLIKQEGKYKQTTCSTL